VIPAEAIEAIEDHDIREVLEELVADSIPPERRPGPEEIPGLGRDCVDALKILPGVELFGDRREALHAALTDLLRRWFFERRSLLGTLASAGSRASDPQPMRRLRRALLDRSSGSVVIDLCVDLLRTGEFGEISATEDVIAGALQRALATFLVDADTESALLVLAIESLRQHALEDPLQALVSRVLDWFRGGGGSPPSGPGPPAVLA
jgi:hypothetical protein